jgi:hypothetical protein
MEKWQSQVAKYDYKTFYVQTEFKTTSEHEWAKFTYMQVEVDPISQKEIGSTAHLLRVCIPVNKNAAAYVDYKCPKGTCTNSVDECDQIFIGINAM